MNTILFVGEHPKTFDVRWHTHEHWELVYCTSGQGSFLFENGTEIHYRAGEVVVIPPRERHANSSRDGFTNIHLTMSEPSFPYRTAFRVADDEDYSVKTAFLQAKNYFISDIWMREVVMEALGYLIASYITVFSSNSSFSEPVEKIRNAIIRNYARTDFALDELISSMPFHYDYLRKLFKKEVGHSPLEYMTNLRMKRAETMLSAMWTNEYTISQIAYMCGFEDALYFSRVFKKYYGCAPSRFEHKQSQIHRLDPGRVEEEA